MTHAAKVCAERAKQAQTMYTVCARGPRGLCSPVHLWAPRDWDWVIDEITRLWPEARITLYRTPGLGADHAEVVFRERRIADQRCSSCGDHRPDPQEWWGLWDLDPITGRPVKGGLGRCGDAHTWTAR